MIRGVRLASLVTAGAAGMVATPLPMLLDADEGVLYGHVARGNPHWRMASGVDGLAIFLGADAYVTPSWYPSKQAGGKVVPTWNYLAVHVYGPVEFFDDAERKLDVVRRLTERQEGERAAPWAVSDAPADYIAGQLRGIVGLRMPITRLEAKRKMSQNKSLEDRAGVASGLSSEGNEAVARLVSG